MKKYNLYGIDIYVTDRNYKFLTAVSFGKIVVFNTKYLTKFNIGHEYGHQLQFKMLGPILYARYIGIPSLIGNILHRFIKFDYYKQPWETWANKLAFKEEE